MARSWLLAAVLACACNPQPANTIETQTDLKVDTVAERGLASVDDVEGALAGEAAGEQAVRGIVVTGVEGPLLAGVREALGGAGLDPAAAVVVAIEATPPEPGGSSGEMTLAITLAARWLHAPDVTRVTGTIRGSLTYRAGSGVEVARAIGAQIGTRIGEELKREQPAELAGPRPPLARAVEVAVGDSLACARHEGGAVRCWGSAGQRIGAVPGLVGGLGEALEIAAANDRACARLADGTVRCWGAGLTDERGQVPVQVCEVAQASALALGKEQGCALVAGGEVRCWAIQGGFDDGCGGARSLAIAGVKGATAIAAGFPEACAILPEGQVTCWAGIEAPAQPMPEVGKAVAIGVGFAPCGLDAGGLLRCWTSLGLAELRLPAGAVPAIEPMQGCARTPAGELLCWKAGGDGPAKVEGLGKVVDVDVGLDTGCAVDEAGTVWCWGSAMYGVTGQRGDSSAPQAVRFVR